VPSPIGNSGKVLSNDGTSLNWQSIGGDVSGPVASQIVQGLRGVPVAATAPADGQILAFSGTLNRWEPKSASGNALAAWPVTRNSDTVLAVGTGPGLRIGETYCQVPSTSACIQISGGTGTLFMFIRPSCELVVAHNLTVSNCTNCTAVEGTGYEVNSFPLASWTATDGVLAAIGISTVTPYGIRPLLAGQNVQFTHSGGSTQINTFSSGVNLGDKALTFEWNNSTAFATVRGRLAS